MMSWEVALYAFIYFSFISWKHVLKWTPGGSRKPRTCGAGFPPGSQMSARPFVGPQVKGHVQTRRLANRDQPDPGACVVPAGPAGVGGRWTSGFICREANAAQAVYASPPAFHQSSQVGRRRGDVGRLSPSSRRLFVLKGDDDAPEASEALPDQRLRRAAALTALE